MFITGKAIESQFRFVPNAKTVQTIWYCLGLALRRYAVKLHSFVWMSNHYHVVLTDIEGELPDFVRDLNSMISRALNANRGRRGANFEREGYNLVVAADREAVLRHCAYTEANPCSAHLVEHALDWGGVSSAGMEYGEVRRILRPNFGMWADVEPREDIEKTRSTYRGRRNAPDSVEIKLERPPGMEGVSDGEIRESVRKGVRQREKEARAERLAEGKGVVGMRRAAKRPFKHAPTSKKKLFDREPKVSGKSADARRSVELLYREFVRAYRVAWGAFKKNRNVVFPFGTWWMHRRLEVRCASSVA